METIYDVVIIGAGGAGLNTAYQLGKFNLNICLIESKADILNLSFHTLGSFLDLAKFDLSPKVIAAPQTEVVMHSKHFHVKKKGNASILNKLQLHKELLEKVISQKITIKTSTRIASSKTNQYGNIESVQDTDGNNYYAKIFIDCTGVIGVLSHAYGLMPKKPELALGLEYNAVYHGPEHQCHLFIGKLYQGGYGWIFPLGNHRAILGYGSFNPIARSELKKRLEAMAQSSVIKKLITVDDKKTYGGSIPITEVQTNFVKNNIVCIGDSVSQVNPLVGEGYRFILEAGYIAAPHIVKAIKEDNNSLLHEYEREWNAKFLDGYVRSKRLQKLADMTSRSDVVSDLCNLFLTTKRSKTFVNIIGGNMTKKDLYLP